MKKKVTTSLKKVPNDARITGAWFVSSRHEEDEHGYSDNTVSISLDVTGAIFLSESETDGGFVYLYPEQVKHLESILKKRAKLLKKGKGK